MGQNNDVMMMGWLMGGLEKRSVGSRREVEEEKSR